MMDALIGIHHKNALKLPKTVERTISTLRLSRQLEVKQLLLKLRAIHKPFMSAFVCHACTHRVSCLSCLLWSHIHAWPRDQTLKKRKYTRLCIDNGYLSIIR
jgi:hypothetical protein